jgi:hypothetical protein
MAARDPRVRAISSTIAALERHHGPNADTAALRSELREARAVAQIRRMVAGLSPEERARLAVAALTPASGDAA